VSRQSVVIDPVKLDGIRHLKWGKILASMFLRREAHRRRRFPYTQCDLSPLSNMPLVWELSGASPARNLHGGIIYNAPTNGKLFCFTQLLQSKELYGLDTASAAFHSWRNSGNANPVFYIESVEESFALTLRNYAKFAGETLRLPLPWIVRFGVHDIKGMNVNGRACLKENVLSTLTIETTGGWRPALDIFLETLWKHFNTKRSNSAREAIVQHLAE
jgi:hypothetical protein